MVMSWYDRLNNWFNAPIDGWSIYDNKGVYMFKDHRPWMFRTTPDYCFGGWEHVRGKIRMNGKHRGRHCFYGSVKFFKRTSYGYRFQSFKGEDNG